MQDDQTHASPDDSLEPNDTGMFHPATDQDTLPQDGETPAAPASDVPVNPAAFDEPQTDTGVDEHEAYDAGTEIASGSDDQREDPDTRVKPLEP